MNGPDVIGSFCAGLLCDGSFCDGSFSDGTLCRVTAKRGSVVLAAPVLIDRSMITHWAGVSGKGNTI